MITKIKHIIRIGDSLYIPLPKHFAELLGLREYSTITVTLDDKKREIIIKRGTDY